MLDKQFVAKLKESGNSVTSARNAVFDVLKSNKPLGMQQLVELCAPTTDRASVYRSIDLFEKLGITQRIHTGWKYKIELTDMFHEHHHHMSCTKCGKLIDIEGDSHIEKDILLLAKQHSFTVTSHQIEIQGLCSDCRI